MNRQQNFLLGVGAGAAAAVALGRLARTRHSIDVAGRCVVHRHLGMASFVEYLERVLGYSRRKARDCA